MNILVYYCLDSQLIPFKEKLWKPSYPIPVWLSTGWSAHFECCTSVGESGVKSHQNKRQGTNPFTKTQISVFLTECHTLTLVGRIWFYIKNILRFLSSRHSSTFKFMDIVGSSSFLVTKWSKDLVRRVLNLQLHQFGKWWEMKFQEQYDLFPVTQLSSSARDL